MARDHRPSSPATTSQLDDGPPLYWPVRLVRRLISAPATAPPLDNEDLLEEILLRLSPQPSSLPRASLVCKRWRRIVSDRGFLRRFRALHRREPPILGFFIDDIDLGRAAFTPVLDPPDHIPAARLSIQRSGDEDERWVFCGCRHGLALALYPERLEAVVYDPLTARQRRVAFPPGLDDGREDTLRYAAVLCAAREEGHVHGDCHSSPFKLALVRADENRRHALACLYQSESGSWGNVISTEIPASPFIFMMPSVLVENAFYWLLAGVHLLEFDFQRQNLAVIEKPADVCFSTSSGFQILRMEGGRLGLAILSMLGVQLWEWKR